MGTMSKSVKCLRDISEEIDKTNNKQKPKISALLKEVIATGGFSSDYSISNVRIAKLLNKLCNTFREYDYRLQKALYAHYFHKAGLKSARKQYKVPVREYDEAKKILNNFSYLRVVECYSQFSSKRFSVYLQNYIRKNMREMVWLHLIIAIGKVNNIKSKTISKRVKENVIDFSASKYSFRIGVYRINLDGTTNEKGIRLFCPKLLGWGG